MKEHEQTITVSPQILRAHLDFLSVMRSRTEWIKALDAVIPEFLKRDMGNFWSHAVIPRLIEDGRYSCMISYGAIGDETVFHAMRIFDEFKRAWYEQGIRCARSGVHFRGGRYWLTFEFEILHSVEIAI